MKKAAISLYLFILLTSPLALAADEAAQLETVTVTATEWGNTTEGAGAYTSSRASTATGMALSLRETPQSVSVVTRQQMDDFQLNGINDLLEYSTGITVEQVETDRVYYTARGFDITNFQQDGLGMPLAWNIQHGDVDTAIFDRVEVVRGAAGLMSGAGNPSATINMVRKRPTEQSQALVEASVGSWDDYRLDADVSGALSNQVGGRMVLVQQDRNSYLDDYHQDKSVLYGVTDLDLSDDAVLTLGASRQDTRSNSPTWGAIPLLYSNGEQTDYDESTSTSSNWSFRDITTDNIFAELVHRINSEWDITASMRRANRESTAELFYLFGSLDSVTETGLFGWTGRYETEVAERMADLHLSGRLSLWGREHDVVMGISRAKSAYDKQEYVDPSYGFPAIGDFGNWNGDIARPDFNTRGDYADFTDRENATYAAGRFQLTDPLTLVAGVRVTDWTTRGVGYNVDRTTTESGRVVPYAELIYDLDMHWSAYGSYTETFLPQNQLSPSLERLDPVEGESREVGLKAAWLDDRLNFTFALFETNYDGLAEYVGMVGIVSVYDAVDFDSQGFEVELAGEVMPGWQVSMGYTDLSIEDQNGNDTRLYVPTEMLRASSSYRLTDLLKVGAHLKWQDATTTPNGLAKQDSYALLDVFARYEINEHLTASLNLNNLTDEKYFRSLQWDQAFYGAPRNAMVSVTYSF